MFLDTQVEKGVINAPDSWLAALQFKALLEAELHLPYMLGVIDMPDDQRIKDVTQRAVDAFLLLYQNPLPVDVGCK